MEGMEVMLHQLKGNSTELAIYQAARDKTIKSVSLVNGEELWLRFTDGTGIAFFDGGQTCCESRYMVCDDNLAEFVGAKFMEAQIKEAPQVESEDVHEVQFLAIVTDKGNIVCSNHNEHNGYYGGFAIDIKVLPNE